MNTADLLFDRLADWGVSIVFGMPGDGINGFLGALDRVARLMKDDRDQNFVAKNDDGVTVNRWLTTGFLAASATTNETAFLTYKVVRSTGILAFDNQARV